VTNIPNDEDFARADKLDRERSRNLDKVCRIVEGHFKTRCAIHRICILPQRDVNFRAYIFFKNDIDIDACTTDGTTLAISEFVREQLERAGRGKKNDITVAFEFDSDENVTRNFGGDYYARLL
jgi:hypothetical protein